MSAAELIKVNVVATFSILGDMVKTIGADRIHLTTLVGPDGDAHAYRPTPADARAIVQADLILMNGLDYEGWIERLLESSGHERATSGKVVLASQADKPLRLRPQKLMPSRIHLRQRLEVGKLPHCQKKHWRPEEKRDRVLQASYVPQRRRPV